MRKTFRLYLFDKFFDFIDVFKSGSGWKIKKGVSRTHAATAFFTAAYLTLLITGVLLVSLFWLLDVGPSPIILLKVEAQKYLIVIAGAYSLSLIHI